LLEDNPIGWGVHENKLYTLVELKLGVEIPKSNSARNQWMALPTELKETYTAVPDKITSAVKRFDMKPPQFYSTINKSKAKAITWEDMRAGFHQLTKFTIDGRTLGGVMTTFKHQGQDKDIFR